MKMTKINALMRELKFAKCSVEIARKLMMDTNTNGIFWAKIDVIQADLTANINLLEEQKNA